MKVRELLSSPECWTTQVSARNANGSPVDPRDPSATCWCLVGAISRCYDSPMPVRNKIRDHLKVSFVTAFNDSATHQEVLDVCKQLDI